MSAATLDSELCFALYSASSRLTSLYRPLLEPHGLTYTQFVVLMALWERDGVSISRLAEKTGLTNATMTPLLRRLEHKRYIKRLSVDGDERQKQIVLTETGSALAPLSKEITEQVFCTTGLTRAQAKEMIQNCHLIAQHARTD
ncbi:MAG: MarR family transcriptional regulator [Pseudomonadota bacterium]